MRIGGRSIRGIYLGLLVLSWVLMTHRKEPLPDGREWREARIFGSSGMFRYRKIEGSNPSLTPLILVHGSPMDSRCFDPILEKLKGSRTILVPDLPGFGASSTGFSELSFTAHAAALRNLLYNEKLSSVHWVAHSQGGGPVLETAAAMPDAIQSLTLLSSVGVQEYELTGDYFLNHAVYGAQWLALEGLRWGLPHFGALDRFLLNTRYARNLFEGDLRPLRGHLERIQAPVLILHGDEDERVTPASAKEHFRIVPQSELVWLKGGQMILMSQPGAVAEHFLAFVADVESGLAPHRRNSMESRIKAADEPFDPSSIMALKGWALWLTLLGIALATFASEDLACMAAGLLVARGLISLPAGIFASFAGIWIGDMALYAVGRYGGAWCIQRAPLRRVINQGGLESARAFLVRKGATAIFISRFTPGMRLPLYVVAGIVRVPALKLAVWFMLAGMAWTVSVVSLAATFGQKATDWLLRLGVAVFPATLALIVLTWWLLKLGSSLATHRGRRMFRSKWQRMIRWEFWPPLVFYPPVVMVAILMGLRRRRLLAFTAVNPAIPHGGVAGESKTDILRHLEKSGCVVPFVSLPAGASDKLMKVKAAFDHFPLVVKPDVGERGAGVVIVHDETSLAYELEKRHESTLVQSYVEGAEFGVFYIRHPHENHGRIFSVTIKVMTSVTGDGARTLEELILDDERANVSQKHFRRIYQDQLAIIPLAGEIVPLARLGSHSRGALFLDGNSLITPELEVEIDRIARTFEGFYFGRFDLRCPDAEFLRRGEGIRLIELNGVTSEATHIYHPHTPLLVGYRTLVRQWRHAYDIGVANAARGAHVSAWREFAILLLHHCLRKSS